MDKPLVSVVTPCYNGEPYLEEFFESLLNQTYENLEMIFVNDGSKDDTEKIALQYKKKFEEKSIPFRYIYQENHGQANAVNNGFKHVNGKYLIWPDSDDILEKDSIKLKVEFLERHKEYNIVRSNYACFSTTLDETILRFAEDKSKKNGDIFLDIILETTFCTPGCYMIRLEAFKEIYPDCQIPETFVGQNWQIIVPLCGKSECGYIDSILFFVREHSDSHSRINRTEEEFIKRENELKRILLLGIEKSERHDRNYNRIVEIKYLRKFYYYYISERNKKKARIYLIQLKKNDALSYDDKMYYLKSFSHFRFHCMQLIHALVSRI